MLSVYNNSSNNNKYHANNSFNKIFECLSSNTTVYQFESALRNEPEFKLEETKTKNNESVWHIATNGQIFEYLSKHAKNIIDCKNQRGLTPLQAAILEKETAKYAHLIRLGASENVKDAEGNNVLHLAARTQDIRIIEKFFNPQRGAETNNNNQTFIDVILTSHPRSEIIQKMLKKGADSTLLEELNILSNKDQYYTYEKHPHLIMPIKYKIEEGFDLKPATYYVYPDLDKGDLFVSYLENGEKKVISLNDDYYIHQTIKCTLDEIKEIVERKKRRNLDNHVVFSLDKYFTPDELLTIKKVFDDYTLLNINSFDEFEYLLMLKLETNNIYNDTTLNRIYNTLSNALNSSVPTKEQMEYLGHLLLIRKKHEYEYTVKETNEFSQHYDFIIRNSSNPAAVFKRLSEIDLEKLPLIKNRDGDNLLHAMVRFPGLDSVSLYLMDTIDINEKNAYGYPPLLYLFLSNNKDREWIETLNKVVLLSSKTNSVILDSFFSNKQLTNGPIKQLFLTAGDLSGSEISDPMKIIDDKNQISDDQISISDNEDKGTLARIHSQFNRLLS